MDYCLKRPFKSHLRDIALITVISFVISLFFIWDNLTFDIIWPNIIYSFLIGTSLWKGSEYVSYLISMRFDYKRNIARFMVLMSFALMIYIVIAILVVNYAWLTIMYEEGFYLALFRRNFLLVLIVQFVVAVIINMIFYIISFTHVIKVQAEQNAKFEMEKLAFEYQALQNQVNPHFLFNSLNSLGVLIETDSKAATRFLKDFAGIFRYSLEKSNVDLISIEEELKFVNSFLSIHKVRFQEALIYEIEDINPGFIMPMSVQMLVENSIKHNVVAANQPLKIRIFEQDGYLCVENNYNPKSDLSRQKANISKETSLGLKNLESRYKMKFNREISVSSNNEIFKVCLPLLKQKD